VPPAKRSRISGVEVLRAARVARMWSTATSPNCHGQLTTVKPLTAKWGAVVVPRIWGDAAAVERGGTGADR
jgi:hypothetical protein